MVQLARERPAERRRSSLRRIAKLKRQTPTQTVIGNAIASKVCMSRNGHLIMNPSFFGAAETFESSGTSDASSDGLACQCPTENHDRVELSTEFTCRLPSSGWFRAIWTPPCD